jgi:hypothetical protein
MFVKVDDSTRRKTTTPSRVMHPDVNNEKDDSKIVAEFGRLVISDEGEEFTVVVEPSIRNGKNSFQWVVVA